jgi:uncharacterized membrane protein YedE/YeeE
MRSRLAGLGIGVVFGLVLSWSGMSSPVVIRQALLFQRSYLFLFFASAVLTAAVGLAVLRRSRGRALLVDAPIGWARERVEGRHIAGSLLFGLGWGISDACPGPIATQIGQGILWALPLMTGVLTGVHLFLRRHATETEPATDPDERRATAATALG